MNEFKVLIFALLIFSAGFVNATVSKAQVSFDLFDSLVTPVLSFLNNISATLFGAAPVQVGVDPSLEIREYPELAGLLSPSETLGDACVCPDGGPACAVLPCQGDQLCLQGQCAVPTSNDCPVVGGIGGFQCCPIGGTTYPTNVLVDPENCGSCGNDCTPGTPVPNPNAANCVAGECQLSNCDSLTASICGELNLGCCTGTSADLQDSLCANFLVDNQNCGGCGNACASDEVCTAGFCMSGDPCSPNSLYGCAGLGGLQCCGSTLGDICTNILADPGNCGGCNNSCFSNEICFVGECTTCGNGSCEQELGESCQNCAECSCGPGSTCQESAPGSGVYQCS